MRNRFLFAIAAAALGAVALGGVALARFYHRRDEAPPAPLSPEERRRLSAVLGEGTEP